MTETEEKSYRRFHFKNSIENFLCFFSSGAFLFFQHAGRGILSQSRMIKNFPGDNFTQDPSISISPVTLLLLSLLLYIIYTRKIPSAKPKMYRHKK